MPSFTDLLLVADILRIFMGKFEVLEPVKFRLANKTSKRLRRIIFSWHTPQTLITEKFLEWGYLNGHPGIPVGAAPPIFTVNGQNVVRIIGYDTPLGVQQQVVGPFRIMLTDMLVNLVAISSTPVFPWEMTLEQIEQRYTYTDNLKQPGAREPLLTGYRHQTIRTTFKFAYGMFTKESVRIADSPRLFDHPIPINDTNATQFHMDYPSYLEIPTLVLRHHDV